MLKSNVDRQIDLMRRESLHNLYDHREKLIYITGKMMGERMAKQMRDGYIKGTGK